MTTQRREEKKRKGGWLFAFVSLSLAQRVALIVLGFFAVGATVGTLWIPERKTKGAELSLNPIGLRAHSVNPDFVLAEAQKSRAEERECAFRSFDPAVPGAAARDTTRQDCTELCERWMLGSLGEGGHCRWGSETVSERMPSGENAANVIPPGAGKTGGAPALVSGFALPAGAGGEAGTVNRARLGEGEGEAQSQVPGKASPESEGKATSRSLPHTGRKGGIDWQVKLISAAQHGTIAQAQEALEHGAQVDGVIPESDGHSALDLAILEGRMEMFSFLIERGADPNRVNPNFDRTPLMTCADHHAGMEFVRGLVKAGANPKLEDSNKHTAKDLAELSGYEEMVTYLSGKEAEADAKEGWKAQRSNK